MFKKCVFGFLCLSINQAMAGNCCSKCCSSNKSEYDQQWLEQAKQQVDGIMGRAEQGLIDTIHEAERYDPRLLDEIEIDPKLSPAAFNALRAAKARAAQK